MSRQAQRRTYPRTIRRLQVRYWSARDDKARTGFTKNLSVTGAFITTPDPPGRGDRLHLELADEGRRVRVYAEVVHSYRVPPEFRRFTEAAMGVRFLDLEDLIGPFLPIGKAEPLIPLVAEPEPEVQEEPDPGEGGAAGGLEGGPDPETAPSPAPPVAPAKVYRHLFETAHAFLLAYRRDLLNGGLFISTSRPARLQERVAVDLRLPGADGGTLRIEGRVVQVVEPREMGGGRTLGAMGIEILDLDRTLAELAPLVASYERS